jgi:hypothetical protein
MELPKKKAETIDKSHPDYQKRLAKRRRLKPLTMPPLPFDVVNRLSAHPMEESSSTEKSLAKATNLPTGLSN